jgi:hypothetical protein
MAKVSKSVFRAATVLSVLLALACPAKADQITTFDIVNGQLQDGASVTGTLTIDTTTGAAVSFYVSVGSPDNQLFTPSNVYDFFTSPANIPGLTGSDGSLFAIEKDTVEPVNSGQPQTPGLVADDLPRIDFTIPVTNLIGYNGGLLGTSTYEYGYSGPPDYTPEVLFSSGSLTPTPEPTTITLLVSGFIAFGGYGLYQRRRGRSTAS